jgi:hypothetical protein
METHNASIYHCVSCGRVVHAELEAEPPQCCGHTMAMASEDTIHKGEVAGETPGSHSKAAPPMIKRREKPR